MILVDTTVWVDHLRSGDVQLAALLDSAAASTHPFIIGEIGLGAIRQRDVVLGALRDLPQAEVADDREVLQFIEQQQLWGLGIGYVDVHLLAAARLTPDTLLWTRDKRLHAAADTLALAYDRRS